MNVTQRKKTRIKFCSEATHLSNALNTPCRRTTGAVSFGDKETIFDNRQQTEDTRHGVTTLLTVSALAPTSVSVVEDDSDTDVTPVLSSHKALFSNKQLTTEAGA